MSEQFDKVPQYSDGELNTMSVLSAQAKAFSEAWLMYSVALNDVIEWCNKYKSAPNKKSAMYGYVAAFYKLKSTEALMHELKNFAVENKLIEWFP